MTRFDRLEPILIHFYTRAVDGQPLVDHPRSEMPGHLSSIENDPLFKKIQSELVQGKKLSTTLLGLHVLPRFFIQLITIGENNGRVDQTLKIILDHFSLYTRFGYTLKYSYTYLAFLLISVLVLLFYYGSLFMGVVATIDAAAPLQGSYRLYYLIGNPYVQLTLIILGGVGLVWALKSNVINILIQHTPYLKQIYFKLISLEVGTLCEYYMDLGLPVYQALDEAVKGIEETEIGVTLQACIVKMKGGRPFSPPRDASRLFAKLPFTSTIGIGESSGQTQAILKASNAFIFTYLTCNMEKEMKTFFKWGIAICGIIVGITTVFIFNSIIYTYSLL